MSRGRPAQNKNERVLDNDIDELDAMERDAKERIAASGRAQVGKTLKLEYPQQKDSRYFYYWAVNNDKTVTGLQDLLERGFEFDRYESGKNKGERVTKTIKGVVHYGMRQLLELREQDLKATRQALELQQQSVKQLNEREYGAIVPGEEGKAIKQELVENPDSLNLMEG